MQYLRNIIFLIIIFVFNAEYANAQVNRDEIRVGQDKILTNSYDDIIVNAKDYTLQNIDNWEAGIIENSIKAIATNQNLKLSTEFLVKLF